MIESKTRVYYALRDALADPSVRYVDNAGGTRSGKTFSTLQVLCEIAKGSRDLLISVVSETMPHLKRGAIRDFKAILADEWDDNAWNKSESVYTFPSGSIIEFFSADQPGKVHGPARDILFINEANHLDYDTARQLLVRTRLFAIFDYNPTHTFWVHENIAPRENCRSIHSTYKDNDYLTAEQVAEIESNKNDANWWRVYGEGKVGQLEGLIFPDFELCDTMPDAAGLREVYGMDFGFTCFEGSTLVTTARGDIPIREVVAGDYVLTRKGYRRIIQKKCNGVREIQEKIIIFNNGKEVKFAATYSHNFNVNGKWKKYGKLESGDKLFMLSPLRAENTKGILPENTQIITTANGKKTELNTQSVCTTQYGKRRTGCLCQRDMQSTTRISTPLITSRKTCNSLPIGSTPLSTETSSNITTSTPTTSKRSHILKRIGRRVGRWLLNDYKKNRVFVNNVARNLLLQMSTKGFALNLATACGNSPAQIAMPISFVNGAAKPSEQTNTGRTNLVQASALITSQHIREIKEIGTRKAEVFDLWVEDTHEYFANGVLVHNCDPSALSYNLIDTGRKIIYTKQIFYSTGMLNSDMAAAMERAGVPKRSTMIFADCAEPKTIAELAGYGWNILPCYKATRKAEQIQMLRGYKIYVTKDSLDAIKEFRSYCWMQDKDGKWLNEPQPFNDHYMDCFRYAIFTYLTQYATAGQYTFGFGY